jgi:AmmeMemoRadiSam system protein B
MTGMSVRPPAVAGRFYPGTAAEVSAAVAQLFPQHAAADRDAVAVMCPHAGWMYSGKLAARTLHEVHIPERVVALCPNHTGLGARAAVFASGSWKVPGAQVPVDSELAGALLDEAASVRGCRPDIEAHAFEHSIEVLIPLLLARQPGLRLVPVVLGSLNTEECVAFGMALARVIQRAGDDVLVLASSDMSHYLPEAETRRRDELALAALATGDPTTLADTVARHDVSMCGLRPACAMLDYARQVGAGSPELVGYTTSGEAFGDYSQVVGYAGVVVPRA